MRYGKDFISGIFNSVILRQIQIDNVPTVHQPFGFQVRFISSDLMLIFDYHWEREFFDIHLARLDLEQAKCTFLDKQRIDGPLWEVIFDINDPHYFGLWSVDNRLVFCGIDCDLY
jgi:hypothetical protein